MTRSSMRYKNLDEVRVVTPNPLVWITMGRTGRRFKGQTGKIANSEIGKYSKGPLYTVVFPSPDENIVTHSFFENELELVT